MEPVMKLPNVTPSTIGVFALSSTAFEVGVDVIDARGVLGLPTHAAVFAFFDTDGNGVVNDADAHSYRASGNLTLEFDGDIIDGNASDAAQFSGVKALTEASFDNLFW